MGREDAERIIQDALENYKKEFENLKKRRSAHMFNMLIMKKELLDEYCKWLFDILFEVEKRLGDKEYDAFQARYPGRLSELLFDVWMNKNGLNYKEVPFMYTEKINKIKKVRSFLAAKFLKKKYSGSF